MSSVWIAAWVAVTRDEHDAASEAKRREVGVDPDLSAFIRETAFKRIGADEAPGHAGFLEWRIDLYAWAFIRYAIGACRSGISSASVSLRVYYIGSESSRYVWALLLARNYEVLPLLCPKCGGER